jgi:hypothetical protein
MFNNWKSWGSRLGKTKRLQGLEIRTDLENFFEIAILNFDFLFYKLRSFYDK